MKSSIDSWGPAGWTYLHTVTFTYPMQPTIEDRTTFVDFLFAFAAVIPCYRCRTDFKGMVQTHFGTKQEAIESKHLENRNVLSKIIVEFHNIVNEKIGKKRMSYENVVKLYTKRKPPSMIGPILFFTILLILFMIILTRRINCKQS